MPDFTIHDRFYPFSRSTRVHTYVYPEYFQPLKLALSLFALPLHMRIPCASPHGWKRRRRVFRRVVAGVISNCVVIREARRMWRTDRPEEIQIWRGVALRLAGCPRDFDTRGRETRLLPLPPEIRGIVIRNRRRRRRRGERGRDIESVGKSNVSVSCFLECVNGRFERIEYSGGMNRLVVRPYSVYCSTFVLLQDVKCENVKLLKL